jgi:hypothetical protein
LIKVGKESAKLANKHDVAINYEVGESIGYQENQFDAIALIYAHFPADKKSSYHKILDNLPSTWNSYFEASVKSI